MSYLVAPRAGPKHRENFYSFWWMFVSLSLELFEISLLKVLTIIWFDSKRLDFFWNDKLRVKNQCAKKRVQARLYVWINRNHVAWEDSSLKSYTCYDNCSVRLDKTLNGRVQPPKVRPSSFPFSSRLDQLTIPKTYLSKVALVEVVRRGHCSDLILSIFNCSC